MVADKCKKWANNFLCARVIKIGAAGCATLSLMSLVMEWATGWLPALSLPGVAYMYQTRAILRATNTERAHWVCVYVNTRGRYCISTLLVRFHPPFVDATHCHWNIFNNNNNNIALCARSILCALRIWWNRSLTHCGVRPLSVRAAHPDAPSCKIDSLLTHTLLLVDCARSLYVWARFN